MFFMNKFILSAFTITLALGSLSASAQMSDRLLAEPAFSQAPSNNALEVTREMTNRLHLNEAQFVKLLPLNRTKISGLNSINHQYKNDEATRHQKIAELEAQFEQECSRILTPSQLSQFQQQPGGAPANTGNGLG